MVASFAGSDGYAAATSQSVTFTITPAKSTITADSKIMSIGASLPTLTFTSTGLVTGDSLTTQPTLSTTATTSSPLGTYPIVISGATASSNYTITLVDGTLTIVADDTVGGYDSTTSRFFLSNSNASGTATTSLLYGVPGIGLIPLVGDWDGNGTETVGLYDPTTSDFYLRNSNSSGIADTVVCFGAAGCGFTPVVGDWTGDGTDTVGLYDPTNSVFYLRNSNTSGMADTVVVYGAAGGGYTPIVGDWGGNGTDTVGLYNSTTSVFYLKNSNTTGYADETFTYGTAGTPIAGDWNGTGKDTVGLYYQTTSTFSLGNSNAADATSDSFMYGPAATSGWTPLAGHWYGDEHGVVTSISSSKPAGPTTRGRAIPITATFTAPVTVTGTPQLTLNAGNGAVPDLIDSVGGVVVNVPQDLTSWYSGNQIVHFKKGPQLMMGPEALIYSRVRHSDSDFMRMGRQQQVVQALEAKIARPHNVFRLPWIGATFMKGVATDLTTSQIMGLAYIDWRAKGAHQYKLVLQGTPEMIGGGSYVVVDPAVKARTVRHFLSHWARNEVTPA